MGSLTKLEEGFELAAIAASNSLAGNLDIAGPSAFDHQVIRSHSLVVPKEAHICGCGVFITRKAFPSGIKEDKAALWGKFTWDRFDMGTSTW